MGGRGVCVGGRGVVCVGGGGWCVGRGGWVAGWVFSLQVAIDRIIAIPNFSMITKL